MCYLFSFLYQICLKKNEDLPYAYAVNTSPQQWYDFSIEDGSGAFLIIQPFRFNATIKVSNTSVSFNNPHFYIPFSNFSITSPQSLSILCWVLPRGICKYNNSVIGTERYTKSALYLHQASFMTCIFLANLGNNVELNQTYQYISGRAVYNGTSISTTPLFFLLESTSTDSVFSLSYDTHQIDPNFKGNCLYQSSFHFTGKEFTPDYNDSFEYLQDCDIQNIQNKWWFYFIAICFIIVLALIGTLIFIFKYHKCSRETYESFPEAPDEIFFVESKTSEPPVSKPVYNYTQPTEQTDLLFYDKSKI